MPARFRPAATALALALGALAAALPALGPQGVEAGWWVEPARTALGIAWVGCVLLALIRAASRRYAPGTAERAVLATGVLLPRYLVDPAAGIPMAFACALFLVCGYAVVEALAPSGWCGKSWYWPIAAALLVPFAVPGLDVRWP